MKKNIQLTVFFLFVLSSMFAQQEKGIYGYENWLDYWTEFKPNKIVYSEATEILSGEISNDTKLYKRDVYLLLGDVYVTDNATLTIEPGTVIIGDFKTKGSLTISKGSKIIAEGNSTDPIIFTSSRSVKKEGDWGGIFILGDAPTNKPGNTSTLNLGLRNAKNTSISYGGENEESDSGSLKYVRIEYAGKRSKKNGYYSAITFAGVGNKTVIENIMVSYSLGDAFSIFGGDTNLNKLVSYKCSSDDFNFNYGAQCNFTNSLAVKSPYVSTSEVSRAISSINADENGAVDHSKKETYIDAKNLTLISISNDLNHDIKLGLINESIFIGKDSTFKLDKSVISGFNPAVILDNKITIDNESLKKISFTSNYFNNCNGNIFVKNITNNEDLENWYGSRIFNNVYSKGPDSETFIDSKSSKRPDYRLRINRIIASSGSSNTD